VNNSKLSRNVPNGYAVRVLHVHDPETLDLFRQSGRPPRYVSIAKIYTDKRDSHNRLLTEEKGNDPVVYVEARCSHKDSPSRKVGYHMAVTRALRTLSAMNKTHTDQLAA
jgi:hypothetical protein